MRASSVPARYADLRSSPRRKAFLPAKVVDRDGAYSVDCTIRCISDGGAAIEFAIDQIVPNHILLIDMRSGTAYKAEVRWRKVRKVGIRFLQTISLRGSVPEDFQHLKRLWQTDGAPPTPLTVKVTPDMMEAGVAAFAAWKPDDFPALTGEYDMARAVFIAMYRTMPR
jgi:hypothetical protein